MLEGINDSLPLIEEYINNILMRLPFFKLEEDIYLDERDWKSALSLFELRKKEVSEKINFLEKNFIKGINDIIGEWEKYTEFYKTYIFSTTMDIAKDLKNFIDYLDLTNNNVCVDNYDIYVREVLNIYTGQDLLKNFSYKDKNYIILGRNGSGKTTLLKRMRHDYFRFNAIVIPATRSIDFGNVYDNVLEKYLNYDLRDIFGNESLANIVNLANDILTYKLCVDKNNICNDVINIFDSLSFGRKLFIDSEHKMIMLYSEGFENDKYSISNGSDGEKSAFLFISLILLCAPNALVLIDEPENHLNTALLNELFDILEKKRQDITFIYCTHNVDFIESRNKPNLIYLGGYNDKNDEKWDLYNLGSNDDLPISTIVNIVGTKKGVLFIEGEKSSLDYKIYSVLFDFFKVIPVGSCEIVKNNCKIIGQGNHLKLNREVYGLIDKDSRDERERKKLKKDKIIVLEYDEIENFLISPIILDYVCEKLNLEDKKEFFKENAIKYVEKNKKKIINGYIKKSYPRAQQIGIYKYDGEISSVEEKMRGQSDENLRNYIPILEKYINDVEKIINDGDYESVIINCQDKGILNCVEFLGISQNEYTECIVESIRKDADFKKDVILNYFKDLSFIIND